MGLTCQSTGKGAYEEMFVVKRQSRDDIVVALAGNPNTGKSTVFNSLTGLKQHTGNWPGKTVTNAQGVYGYKDKKIILVDLPGTYSLLASSVEEEVARDFICYGKPDATVVVLDATCLERNLNLVLQVLEITKRVVVCINLLDEGERKGISVDLEKLKDELGVPVVGTNARDGVGLAELKDAVYQVAVENIETSPVNIKYSQSLEAAVNALEPVVQETVGGEVSSRWLALRLLEDNKKFLADSKELFKDIYMEDAIKAAQEIYKKEDKSQLPIGDSIVMTLVNYSENIWSKTVQYKKNSYNDFDRKLDKILTSKVLGFPIMLALLGLIFWLTIAGANIPSEMLAAGFFWLEERFTDLFMYYGWPDWVHGILVLGVYRTLAWVVSVMLPPMAIFFPIFTLLEDLGYLPRVAFNLDGFFKRACAHGKQALTMCMGFGCNAAGVIACRIIDSPRERLIATITNNFVPCNGRFPTLIALSAIFIAGGVGAYMSIVAALTVLIIVVFGILITLLISKILSVTILKGLPSSFTLELPPYRKPQIGRIIVRSIFDRTIFVLARAVCVAAPAGLFIWLIANVYIGDTSLLYHCASFLNPFAQLIGVDGFILMAFILGLPANEIVIPILLMSYMSTGYMIELDSIFAMRDLLIQNGWTWLTAVCTMILVLNHFPCATTLLTIRKETQSWKWTLIAFFIPTFVGIFLCFIVAQIAHLLGLA